MAKKISRKDILKKGNKIVPKKKLKEGDLDRLFNSLIELLEGINKKRINKNISLSKDFLEISKNDLRATRILFKNDLFSLAVYHLQQAVEKTTKAYGLSLHIINDQDLSDISHETPRVFVKMIEEKWIQSYIDVLRVFYPSLKAYVKKLENLIEKKSSEILRWDEKKIKELLKFSEKFETLDKEETRSNVYDVIELFLSLMVEEKKKIVNVVKSMFKPEFLVKVTGLFTEMYLLSIITYPHAIYTRYPDGPLKPKNYTQDTGIVKMVLEICNELEEANNVLEFVLKEINGGKGS